jgi:hypothetical protein
MRKLDFVINRELNYKQANNLALTFIKRAPKKMRKTTMQLDTRQYLDRFLGMPMCWLLTIARQIENLIRSCASVPRPKNVLIITLSELGSTVLAYSVVPEIQRSFSGIELCFLVFEKNAGSSAPYRSARFET